MGLDKVYEIEILFGIETESYDVLGLIKEAKNYKSDEVSKELPLLLPRFKGEIEQAYPPYSSKPFNGKPLYYWARRGELEGVDLPKEMREIHSLDEIGNRILNKSELHTIIMDKLERVEGDFNQEAIIKGWDEYLAATTQESWLCSSLKVSCRSGTYMRSLAHEIGKAVGVGACALSITRTKIGTYTTPTQPIYSKPSLSQ